MTHWRFDIASTWDGEPLSAADCASVTLVLPSAQPALARVDVRAPFYGDPPPDAPAGSTDRLWEHEVVELMLLGDNDRYLELEFGPFGHYLLLQLSGERNVTKTGLELLYASTVTGQVWTATAELPRAWLPAGLRSANAYAIHGPPHRRSYAAWRPPLGVAPDFHRLERFGALDDAL